MKDELISFETAKLAKEKGFDIQVLDFWTKGKKPYISQGLEYMSECYTKSNWNNGQGSYPTHAKDVECSAPTQSLLQRWLREVHNIEVISFRSGEGYSTEYDYSEIFKICKSSLYVKYKTYEQALEVGLQEALKLLP